MTPSKRTQVPACVSSSAAERARRLACRPLSGLATREERLHEVARHAVRRYESARRLETSERRNFAAAVRRPSARACGRARSASARPAWRRRASGDSRPCARRGRVTRRPRVRPSLRNEVGHPSLGRASDRRCACARRSDRAPHAPSSPSGRLPVSSKPARAASIASRAARFCRARRRTTPSARSARARPNGSPTASCRETASASTDIACIDVTARGSDEPAAACRVREHPVATQPTAVPPPRRRDVRRRRRRGRARAAPRPVPLATSTCSVRPRPQPRPPPSAPQPRSARPLPRSLHSRDRRLRAIAAGAQSCDPWSSASLQICSAQLAGALEVADGGRPTSAMRHGTRAATRPRRGRTGCSGSSTAPRSRAASERWPERSSTMRRDTRARTRHCARRDSLQSR